MVGFGDGVADAVGLADGVVGSGGAGVAAGGTGVDVSVGVTTGSEDG